MNKLIFFTKFLKDLNVAQMGETVKELGFDGLDLTVRKGYAVNPANVRQTLPDAVKLWRGMGLELPLISLEGGCVDPNLPEVEAIYESASKAGTPFIKLGYWYWKPGDDYRTVIKFIRGELEKFDKLSRKYNVCTLYHTHSKGYYGGTAAGMLDLIDGFDPKHIAVYIDPAHLSVEAEPLEMVLPALKSHLRMVGMKNIGYVSSQDGDVTRWKRHWGLLTEGLVDWRKAIGMIRETGYTGPFSLHSEYSKSEERHSVIEMVRQEMKFLKPMFGK